MVFAPQLWLIKFPPLVSGAAESVLQHNGPNQCSGLKWSQGPRQGQREWPRLCLNCELCLRSEGGSKCVLNNWNWSVFCLLVLFLWGFFLFCFCFTFFLPLSSASKERLPLLKDWCHAFVAAKRFFFYFICFNIWLSFPQQKFFFFYFIWSSRWVLHCFCAVTISSGCSKWQEAKKVMAGQKKKRDL